MNKHFRAVLSEKIDHCISQSLPAFEKAKNVGFSPEFGRSFAYQQVTASGKLFLITVEIHSQENAALVRLYVSATAKPGELSEAHKATHERIRELIDRGEELCPSAIRDLDWYVLDRGLCSGSPHEEAFRICGRPPEALMSRIFATEEGREYLTDWDIDPDSRNWEGDEEVNSWLSVEALEGKIVKEDAENAVKSAAKEICDYFSRILAPLIAELH